MTDATGGTPDLTNLERFLDHLEPRDADAAAFARRLVHADGWRVRSFVGPVQMDVWELVVERDGWWVRFGVERGYSDGILAMRGEERLPLGSLAAARAWLELKNR